MPSPLFSIILPTFCAETVVAQCLESLRRQTCRDYEIVIVDGCSKDKTVEIILNHREAFGKRLIIHSEKDGGVYDAMNKGIGFARGEWLYFLGADDRLHDQNTLRDAAAFIQRHPDSHLVYGDVILQSNSSRYDGVFDLDKLLFQKNICHQAAFYRKTVFDKIGCYNLRYRIWADWDLNIRCFQHPAFVLRHMDIVIAYYNDTSGISMQEDLELRKRLPVFIGRSAKKEGIFSGMKRLFLTRRQAGCPKD